MIKLKLLLISLTFLVGCQSYDPIETADYVDLQRFSGDWYVIAAIPTFIEKNAYGAIETYEPPVDGKVATTFSFYEGGFDGEFKQYNPTGFVGDDGSNAIWGMQFIWPIKAEYRVLYVDEAYETTIIGRSKRDYVWIMARDSQLSESVYDDLVNRVVAAGYDISQLRVVPQKPSS